MHIRDAIGYLEDTWWLGEDEELGKASEAAADLLGGGPQKRERAHKRETALQEKIADNELAVARMDADARIRIAEAQAQRAGKFPRVKGRSGRDKPRVQARSSKGGGINSALVAAVAERVQSRMDPRLRRISAALGLAENQREATSEHLYLTDDRAYRKRVIELLMALAGRLPANNSAARRVRNVGIMSGLT